MTLIDPLRRYLRSVRGHTSDESTDEGSGGTVTTGQWSECSSVDPVGYDPEELQNRADVLAELGLTPVEFVTRLLEEQHGRLKQQAFTDFTDWSEGTVSRVLQEAEEDGEIVRIRVGREKIVCLPERVPEAAGGSAGGDRRSA